MVIYNSISVFLCIPANSWRLSLGIVPEYSCELQSEHHDQHPAHPPTRAFSRNDIYRLIRRHTYCSLRIGTAAGSSCALFTGRAFHYRGHHPPTHKFLSKSETQIKCRLNRTMAAAFATSSQKFDRESIH